MPFVIPAPCPSVRPRPCELCKVVKDRFNRKCLHCGVKVCPRHRCDCLAQDFHSPEEEDSPLIGVCRPCATRQLEGRISWCFQIFPCLGSRFYQVI